MKKNRRTFDSYEELETVFKKDLLKHFTPHGNEFTLLNYFEFRKYDSGDGLSARIYTDKHRYCIATNVRGYLGCTYGNRKPYPGEDWTRGRDLPDGEYGDKTWEKIRRSILWEEMESLSTGYLSKIELSGIDTNNRKAKELADLRREQASMEGYPKVADE